MGRTIKLLLYFFAYQLAFMGVAICGYMLYRHTFELPKTLAALYTNLIMLPQILSTAALGISLLPKTISYIGDIHFSDGLMDQLLQRTGRPAQQYGSCL